MSGSTVSKPSCCAQLNVSHTIHSSVIRPVAMRKMLTPGMAIGRPVGDATPNGVRSGPGCGPGGGPRRTTLSSSTMIDRHAQIRQGFAVALDRLLARGAIVGIRRGAAIYIVRRE